MSRINIKMTLTDGLEVPGHMYIGVDCHNNHGVDGKTIRYRKAGSCVDCVKAHNLKVDISRCRSDTNEESISEVEKISEYKDLENNIKEVWD